jgi:hypothetical protein
MKQIVGSQYIPPVNITGTGYIGLANDTALAVFRELLCDAVDSQYSSL